MKQNYQFANTIQSKEALRELIGQPSKLVQRKVITYLDRNCEDFIARSPFLVLSTANEAGDCDVSPRGDHAGFVRLLNEKTLVIPERPGNKRIDSMNNILSNPRVGLLFFIPGLGETLRVNGSAKLVVDDKLLEEFAVNGKKPVVCIAVEVEECFIHCAKAFKRSKLWEPEAWEDQASLPSAAKIIFEHANLPGETKESIQNRLEESYSKRLY